MKKRRFICHVVILIFALSLILNISVFAADSSERIMSNEDSERIIQNYSKEIKLVENLMQTNIHEINSTSCKLIMSVVNMQALDKVSDEFLFDDIRYEITKAKAEWNAYQTNRERSSKVTISDVKVTEPMYIYGKYHFAVPAGQSRTESYSFSINPNVTISGHTIVGFNIGVGRSITTHGPNSTDKVGNKPATHRYSFTALNGCICHYSGYFFDDYGQMTPIEYDHIDDGTAYLTDFTAFARTEGNRVYVYNCSGNLVNSVKTWQALENRIESDRVKEFI